MGEKFPKFRYHPDPIKTGVIVSSIDECPVCNKRTGYTYVGPIYAGKEVEGVCPWCIANGKAADKYDATFVDEDEVENISDDTLVNELTKRTPGYFFPQDDVWPAHCGDYCTLLGKVTWQEIEQNLPDLVVELEKIRDRLEITEEVLREDLSRKNSPLWATLFQCKKCKKYRLIADYS